MILGVFSPAEPAPLISAAWYLASHMIAAVIFVYDEFTIRAKLILSVT